MADIPTTGTLVRKRRARPLPRDSTVALGERFGTLAERAADWLLETLPALRRWLGDQPELQLRALGGSVVTHLVLILLLGMMGYAATSMHVPEFRTEVLRHELTDFATLDTQALAEIEETTITPVGGSFAPITSAILAERYALNGSAAVPMPAQPRQAEVAPELKAHSVSVAGFALPKPTKIDDSVSIRGNGAEHVENVEGAVDRIAIEILRRLEQGHTLVVWAFDSSGSLLAERRRLSEHIADVYRHIAELDQESLASGDALLTTVVAFGKDRSLMLDEPAADSASILEAIRRVPIDESGIESTFRTTAEIARRFGRYTRDGKSYRAMLIIVTDEVGDDEDALEPAIAAANGAKMPVYVLGSTALFGKAMGFMDYTDPKTNQTFHGLPVRQGPESPALEGIRLPFWYDGPQYDMLDSGFGPYALSRLAGASGGTYFITRLSTNRFTFDPDGLGEYRPDWVSREQYLAMLNKYPLRRAVMRAGVITQQNLPGMPHFRFPAMDAPEFKDVMSDGQEIVARVQYTVDEALGVTGAAPGEPTIASVAQLRDRETSRRWQAHYDLLRGRLMAMRIRCLEYNHACARVKRDPPKFARPGSNAWRLEPDTEIHLGESAVKAGKEATELLERVLRDHPGTPWALLAQRELKDPLGLKWVELRVPPPARPREGDNGNNNRPNRPAPPPRPVELPKL
jgi:hypothetical protein